ncbi:MAG: hypothetical protein ILM98_01820 [Kiritimatiellae bacterium]|nr:hypothetical protein [Kiritimatiellia bacterium]
MKTQGKTKNRQTVKANTTKTAKKHRTVPLYDTELMTAEEFFKLGSDKKKKAKPVGRASNPDDLGVVVVDKKAFERLCGRKIEW